MTALSELNVTALIDLGFALLIIFMISTPLIEQEQTIPMNLPISTGADSRNQDVVFREIIVLPDGYLLDGVEYGKSDLESQLEMFAAMRKPPVINIKADRTTLYQEVITVLDMLKRTKLSKISLDTQSSR